MLLQQKFYFKECHEFQKKKCFNLIILITYNYVNIFFIF